MSLCRISFVAFDLLNTVFCLKFVRWWSFSAHAILIFSKYVALAFAYVEQVFYEIRDFLVYLVGLSGQWEAEAEEANMLFEEDLLALVVVCYPIRDDPDEQFSQPQVIRASHDRSQDWEQILLLKEFQLRKIWARGQFSDNNDGRMLLVWWDFSYLNKFLTELVTFWVLV